MIALRSLSLIPALYWVTFSPLLAQTAPEPAAAPTGLVAPASGSRAPALPDLVHQLNNAYIGVFEKVAPSVVVIEIEKPAEPSRPASPLDLFKPQPDDDNQAPGDSSPERSEGSGIICREDGYIYTNSHVVEDDAKISVTLKDGRKFPAKLIGRDSWSDVAVIKIDAKQLPVPVFADSDLVRIGQIACVIGAPYDLTYSFTAGVVSAKGRKKILDNQWSGQFEDFIQTDASINPGNSGGPLLDIDGQVIGMNSLIQGFNKGLGFAISSNLVRKVGEEIIAAGKVQRPWLGLGIASVEDYPPEKKLFGTLTKGVVVTSIRSDTPAYHSELRPSDVILSVDNVPVNESIDLQHEIQTKKVGQTVHLKVWRAGKELVITLTTAELPGSLAAVASSDDSNAPEEPESNQPDTPDNTSPTPPLQAVPEPPKTAVPPGKPSLGLEVQTLSPELAAARKSKAKTGAIVTDVTAGSPAQLAGLKIGDIITEINAKPVLDAPGLIDVLQKRDLQKGVLLFVEREGGSSYLVLKNSR